MIDSREFVLSRERVEWLLTKYPNWEEYCIAEKVMYYLNKGFFRNGVQKVDIKKLKLDYDNEYVEWLVCRELLYCEFTKDYLFYERNPLSNNRFKVSFKWEKVGLDISDLRELVVRLEESRG